MRRLSPENRWCPRRDSNPHTSRHMDLNHARLPIPPRGHCILLILPTLILLHAWVREPTLRSTVLLATADCTSGRVVPTEGLEPPHLAAHGPEPCASTNSATWALLLRLLLKLIQYQALSFFARSTSVVLVTKLPHTVLLFLRFTCCRCERAEIIADGWQKSKTLCRDCKRPFFASPSVRRTAFHGARFVRRIPWSSVTLRLSRCQSNHGAGRSGIHTEEFKKTI